MRALVAGALTCAVVMFCSVARADSIKHPSGFTFDLPNIGKNWEQEIKGDLIIASDESDTLPELKVFVFPPKKEGTLADLQGRLATEVPRPGVTLDGDAIKTVKVADAKTETIGDASAVTGTLTLNSDKAAFAIVQRGGKSLILVAVPKSGIFDRGNSNFRALVKGLKAGAGAVATKPANPPPTTGATAAPDTVKIVAEMMPEFSIVKDVTATSTFIDKKHKGAYDPANVVWFGVADDKDLGAVPKTAWCEGKPDEGVGEALTINFARPENLESIEIAAGVWLNDKLFNANNQITAIDVGLDGKTTTAKPGATREWLTVKVGQKVSTITLKLASIKKGKMNDSCISGVRINHGHAQSAVVKASDLSADAMAALPGGLAAIQAALVDVNYASLQNVLEFPFNYNYVMGPKKTKLANWKAAEAQCKATGKKRLDDSLSSKCPTGVFFTPPSRFHDDLGKLELTPEKSGELTVQFPVEGGTYHVWRLKWRDNAWRLKAIDYIQQRHD